MSEVVTVPHLDQSEKLIHFARWQDVEPILENNKRLQNTAQNGESFRHIASIPNVILEQWLFDEWKRGNTTIKLSGEEFDRLVFRKLQDPDWKWLRTDK